MTESNFESCDRRRSLSILGTTIATLWAAPRAMRASGAPAGGDINVNLFGAAGDGARIDTGAIQAAIDHASEFRAYVRFPPGTYKSGPLTIEAPVTLIFEDGAQLVPSLDTTGNEKLLTIRAPDVEIVGGTFGPLAGVTRGNRYIIHAMRSADRLKLTGCAFRSLTASDGLVGLKNLFVTHAVYLDGIRGAEMNDCDFDSISGAAIFAKAARDVQITKCRIRNTRWYSINADHDCDGWEIASNSITGDDPLSRYWGGSINIMSQPTGRPNSNFNIHDNFFDGFHNYGAVVRCLSINGLALHHNVYGNRIQAGRIEPSAKIQYIAIDRRGAVDLSVPANGPCNNVHVYDELMHAGPGVAFPIYVKNSGVSKRDLHRNILIERIRAFSATPGQSFANLAMVHGLTGGIQGIRINDCVATIYPAVGVPLPGGIGVASTDERGEIAGAELRRNQITSLSKARPRQPYEIGIFVEQNATDIQVADNILENFRYGIRVANRGVTRISGVDANHFVNCTQDVF